MKINAEAGRKFLKAPEPKLVGALIHGADSGLVAHNRRLLQKSLLGDSSEDEFLTTWLNPDDLRRRTGAGTLLAACTQRSFFADQRRVVIIDGAGNLHTPAVQPVLEELVPEDAFLIVCAGELDWNSSLRKLFEGERRAVSLAAEPEPMTVAKLRQEFTRSGAPEPNDEAADYLITLAQDLDWGSFRMLLEKIALYVRGETEPFGINVLDECGAGLGGGREAAQAQIDALTDAVAEGGRATIADLCRKLAANGSNPVKLLIMVSRHFLLMHRALAGTRGRADADPAVRKLPLHPARRKAMQAHIGQWNLAGVESALQEFHAGDLALRGGSTAPAWATAERAMMRAANRISRKARR